MRPSVKNPRKGKLRKTILKQRANINHLKKKVNPKKKSKLAVEDAISVLEACLPASLIKLIFESQVRLFSTPSKTGYRYSSELKAFAVTLYGLNCRAYKMLSKYLRLPCKTTIVKLLGELQNRPGLTEPAMNVISSRV